MTILDVKDIIKKLRLADEICNFLKEKQKTRYRLDELHVSDILTCSAKLYLDRAFESAYRCGQLAIMKTGLNWEIDLTPKFRELGYYTDLQFIGEIITVFQEEINVLASLDYVDDLEKPEVIIELKFTMHTQEGVKAIVGEQSSFINKLGKTKIPYPKKNYEIFHNIMMQLAAYYRAAREINPGFHSIRLLYIFNKDDIVEFVFDTSETLGFLNYYYGIFLEFINSSLYALEYSKERYKEETFLKLLRYEISTDRIIDYYQCDACPYRELEICPGLPPIRKWRKELNDIEKMENFRNFWKKHGFDLPPLPDIKEFIIGTKWIPKYVKDTRMRTGCRDIETGMAASSQLCEETYWEKIAKTPMPKAGKEIKKPYKTRWYDTIDWVKKVREILNFDLPKIFKSIDWLGIIPKDIELK
ncbi:MAG: hypothetical protein ACTSQJ_00285 [Promethearchaeota archaeon]